MKNKTHTHRGHCQSCGRTQAVDVKHNFIAKHGYTVDFGFFNNTCTASNALPLEMDKSITEQTIVSLTDYVNHQSSYLEGLEAGKVKTLDTYWVSFSTSVEEGEEDRFHNITYSKDKHEGWHETDKYSTQFSYDSKSFENHVELLNQRPHRSSSETPEEVMERLVRSETKKVKSNIDRTTTLKQQLIQMKDRVHGQPLINVADQ